MRSIILAMMSLALSVACLGGCDREVSHSEKTSTNPITGTQTTKEQSTYQRSDGSTYTNSSSNSSNGNGSTSSSSSHSP